MPKYTQMSEEELKELAKEKKRNGCFKQTALKAQEELWKRNQYISTSDRFYEKHTHLLQRSIEDVQYNG